MKIRDKILYKLKKIKSADNLTLYKKFRNRVMKSNKVKQCITITISMRITTT